MKAFFLVAVSLLLLGCGGSYEQTPVKVSQSALDRSRPVLISVPQDGIYGARAYAGSGQMTAAAFRAAFLRYTGQADVTADCHGDDCFDRAATGRYGYYVRPEILHWEDRATEWSAISDKLEVRVTVYDAATRREIASQILTAKSSIWTLGGDHPQDLLRTPANDYVAQLYR